MKRAPRLAAAFALGAAVRASAAPGYEFYAKLYERLMSGASAAAIEDELPGLAENLKIAEKVSAKDWTDCTPFDELAKAPILPDKVMDALGIPHRETGGVVHAPAGIMHTYGYLFSQLKTSYGLKGKRWIESRLDERLGLPAGSFGPLPPRGEFLTNLTAVLRRLTGGKGGGYLEQRVTWKTPEGKLVKESIFTHLVALKPLPGFETTDSQLLIYSVVRAGKRRFVTAFPVNEEFAQSIRKTPSGTGASFKPRYNLYVDPSWAVVAQEILGYR